MIKSTTVKEITFWNENLIYVIRNVSFTFICVGVEKIIRKRAQIWDSCSLQYLAIMMQKV